VDVSAFDQVLGPELACAGLDGLYLNKVCKTKLLEKYQITLKK
jgi:hypothetical protein